MKTLKTGGNCYFRYKDSSTKLQCEKKNGKSQGNMIPPKNYNNLPIDYFKYMEVWNLHNKKFKIAILEKLNKL